MIVDRNEKQTIRVVDNHLKGNGTVIEEILKFVIKSRCGVPDFPLAFTLTREQRNKSQLS